ncbi:MAG: IS982 family transposase [Acidobacteria bacterium]|nr:IS982 family transposase [Acidobacteriota bacterium]
MVYCLVVTEYRRLREHVKIRHGGFRPALTDEEVMTIEICGEYLKHNTDKDLFAYFYKHYRHFFPDLTNRSLFVRQAANLCRVKAEIQQQLVRASGHAQCGIQVIDTLPLPVCTYTRARRDRCFPLAADYGYCAAKDLHYYGFKLGLRVTALGLIVDAPLLSARPHDVTYTETLIAGCGGLVPADKGFIDAYRQSLLQQRYGTHLITPPRTRMQSEHPPALLKACRYLRKVVETIGSHLTERFSVTRIRVHDLWHYQHRLIRKILAHTVAVFLNLQLGREPLDLDGLVSVGA